MASDAGVRGRTGTSYRATFAVDPASLAPAVLGGLIAGVFVIVASISYPSLIFAGELQAYQSLGIGMALVGSCLLAAVVALLGSYPGTVASTQDAPAVVLGVMTGAVATRLAGVGTEEQVLATVVLLIVLSAAVAGTVFLTLGVFRLGNLVRYVPYPVVGGFLGGIGWLLIRGGFSAMASMPLSAANLPQLFEADVLIRWFPGVALAVLLWTLQRRRQHYLNLPLTIGGAILLFWLAAWVTGMPGARLRADGWLLWPFPEGGLWAPSPQLAALQHARWDLVVQLIPEMGTLVVIALITLLLNASSLELAVGRDVDLNRELQASGIANLCSALGGAFPGYMTLSGSRLASRIGAPVRLVGLITALVCGLTLFFGASALFYVPKLVIDVLILYVGLDFFLGALFDAWFRLPKADYFVLLVVFVGVAFVGVFEGIVLGIIVGVALFVINYSRISVVRQALSGADVRSNVDRSETLRSLLQNRGEQIYVLKLQGYIFFGSSNRLLARIRDRLADARRRPLGFLVLDFTRVNGLDSSALISFTKVLQYAEQYGFTLIFTSPSPDIVHALQTAGIYEGQHPRVRVFDDLDHGLEYSEGQILAWPQDEPSAYADLLEEQLRRTFPDAAEVGRLICYLDKDTWREGERLIHQGDASKDMFFVESGRVSVQLDTAPGHTLRLRTMGAGTVVGEVALYLGLPRSASVVADTATTTYRLAADRLADMKRNDPEVAAMFHEFMARTLAARLLDTNRLLEAYSDS